MSGRRVPVVAACLIRDGRVLATQRAYGDDVGFDEAGWWEFPGGKVGPGEDPAEALRREIAEELSAAIDVGEIIATVTHEYPALTLELTCYRCVLTTPYRLAEHRAARWLGADELDTVDWLPADLAVLPALKEVLLGGRRLVADDVTYQRPDGRQFIEADGADETAQAFG